MTVWISNENFKYNIYDILDQQVKDTPTVWKEDLIISDKFIYFIKFTSLT